LRPHVDALRAADPANAPTFFDATTATALLLFAEAGVDRVVLEVGLGGRLDSTNIVAPAVTCVTSIELEHTDKLGNTLAEIAAEKAGILKPGVPAVAGGLRAEARAVLSDRAREVGTTIEWLGDAFAVEVHAAAGDGTALTLRDGELEIELTLPVLGVHQAENAALALACARRAGVRNLAAAARRGLEGVRLPGRVEVVGRSPLVIVDGAHTAVSARALAVVLAAQSAQRRHLVLSISIGKNTREILHALLPGVDSVTVSCVDPLRSIPASALAALVRAAAPGLDVLVEPDPRRALCAARAGMDDDDLLCATGSVYMAGLARAQLGPARSSRSSIAGD
jgi:dihydrofolate synthase/folylpolyglutamate synthase